MILRNLIFASFAFCLPLPLDAAWAHIGTLGTAQDKTSGTSIVLTTSATAEAANVVMLVVAKDNAATADGNTSEFTSISDSAGGNTWVKALEFCNAQAAADAGATVALWYSKLTNQISSGGTITANFSDARTASTASAWEFTVGAGNVVSIIGTGQLATDGADPGLISISGLAAAQHLFFYANAGETNSTTAMTSNEGYNVIDGNQTSGAAADTNMSVRGEWGIEVADSQGANPSFVSADHAGVFVAFDEAAPPSTGKPVYYYQQLSQQ